MAHTLYTPLAPWLLKVMAQLNQQPEPRIIRIGGTPDGSTGAFVEVIYDRNEDANKVFSFMRRCGYPAETDGLMVTIKSGVY